MAYSTSVDYQAKINEAVSKGDMQSAAKYEQQRNEKITGTGDTKHQTTNNYSQYLNSGGSSSGSSGRPSSSSVGSSVSSGSAYNSDVDWSNYIQDLYSSGVTDPNAWAYGIDNRYQKATSVPGMEKYANDNFQQWANAQYQDLLKQQKAAQQAYNYQEVYDYAGDARDAAIQSGIASLQQQIPGINQNYDELARQAYIQKMMAEKALPSQLDAVGITGQGASESAIAQQNNAYLQTLSNSELARQNALEANQRAQTNVRNTADLQYAQDATNIAMQQAQAAQAYMQLQRQQQQDLVANALNAAGLTGRYGSNPTLAYQQLQSDNQYRNAQLNQNQQGIDLDRQQMSNSNKAAIREAYFALYAQTGDYKYLELVKQFL